MSIRTTFVLLMFLSVVAGYFMLANFRSSASTEPTTPWFYTTNMDDIRSIRFTTSDNKAIGFLQDQDKAWRFDDQFSMQVDYARWGGVTLLLSGPRSRRALFPKVEDPEQFGLNQLFLKIDVPLTGNRNVTVGLGDKTPDQLNYYIVQEGNPALYLIDGTWGDVLARLTSEPPFPAWYYKIDPTKVLFLKVTHQGQDQSFRLERFLGEGDVWRFVGADGDVVDSTRWNKEIKPGLGGPSTFTLVKKGVDGRAKYGLDASKSSINVEYQPPNEPDQEDPDAELRRTIDLRIGSLTPDGKMYYAQPSGQDYVVSVDKDWVDNFTKLVTTPPVKPAGAK